MNFEEYIKNETKSLNLKLLSEETRYFIPEITGNFIEDKKLFSNFWNKVKLEKVIQNIIESMPILIDKKLDLFSSTVNNK